MIRIRAQTTEQFYSVRITRVWLYIFTVALTTQLSHKEKNKIERNKLARKDEYITTEEKDEDCQGLIERNTRSLL